MLALHSEGLTAEELALEIYGADVKAVTIRAEMSRLRRLLGCLLLAHPYRLLADVEADFLDVARLVHTGDPARRRAVTPARCWPVARPGHRRGARAARARAAPRGCSPLSRIGGARAFDWSLSGQLVTPTSPRMS